MSWSGRPLLDNDADAALFTDREAERDQVDLAVRAGLNVAVVGTAGSGKTSLLRQLQRQWRRQDRTVVFVDGRAVGSMTNVLGAVLAGVDPAGEPVADLRSGVDRLRSLPAVADPPVVVLDGVPDPEGAHALFGRMRDELWAAPLRWVVSVRDDERAGLLRPPADAFFEQVVTLPELSDQAAMLLLKVRGTHQEGLPDHEIEHVIAAAGSRRPRALLDTARTALARPELVGSLAAMRADLVRRLEAVGGRPAVMLAAELEQLGGASASDQRLLDRLGWTRPHATRMLRRLEQAGLVSSSDLPTGGGGRPRKVYRIIDPVQ